MVKKGGRKRDKRGREAGIIKLHEGETMMDERKRGMMGGRDSDERDITMTNRGVETSAREGEG